jgi:hypothetical protein
MAAVQVLLITLVLMDIQTLGCYLSGININFQVSNPGASAAHGTQHRATCTHTNTHTLYMHTHIYPDPPWTSHA